MPDTPTEDFTIVVPYRNRPEQLSRFVSHMEAFLQDQPFRILVVEQSEGLPFNRGALLNIGFSLACSTSKWITFHDVDMLPLDNSCQYRFPEYVLHHAGNAEQFGYRMPYRNYIGGVLSVTIKTFQQVNGYSNRYWGWGAEDDDLYLRLWLQRIPIVYAQGLYRSLPHDRPKPGIDNAQRYAEHLKCSVSFGDDKTLQDARKFRRAAPEVFGRRADYISNLTYDGLSTVSFDLLAKRPLHQYLHSDTSSLRGHEIVTVSLHKDISE